MATYRSMGKTYSGYVLMYAGLYTQECQHNNATEMAGDKKI
jgi:hypothetical protein